MSEDSTSEDYGNPELLILVRDEMGHDTVFEMLKEATTDSVVCGICKSCHTIEECCEPDARNNHCSNRNKKSVESILSLAGLI